MNEKIRYSIIIPHHDIPELLDRCLKSMPWERDDTQVIVVDDASSEKNVAAVKADFKACPQWHGKGMAYSLVYDFFYPNYRYRFLFWLRTCEVSMSYGKWGG